VRTWLYVVRKCAHTLLNCTCSPISGRCQRHVVGLGPKLILQTVHCSAVNLQDPSGARVRLRLQPLLQDVASSLLQQDSPSLFSLSSPLGLTGGVPLLPVSTAAFTRELGLEGNLGLCVCGGGDCGTSTVKMRETAGRGGGGCHCCRCRQHTLSLWKGGGATDCHWYQSCWRWRFRDWTD
jgi:hypothetical protein